MRSKENKELELLKQETARELGICLKPESGEPVNARDAGKVGGNMVRKMINAYGRTHAPER